MSSELEKQEKRRGERVLIRVPVTVRGVTHDGRELIEAAEAAVISRNGALLRTPSVPKMGSTLTVTHGFSKQTEQFRVIWIADRPTAGRWDIGVEAVNLQEDFWGIRFPSRDRKV